MKIKPHVIVPNWNGFDFIAACLAALEKQTTPVEVVVVDNGSTDGSVKLLESKFPKVILLKQASNLGFAGGVNVGVRYAMERRSEFVLLLNNDAVAEEGWADHLIKALRNNPSLGIATSKITTMDNPPVLDSTGEQFSSWGLPFPRGRGKTDVAKYDSDGNSGIFGASGGASAYRVRMLDDIGLFDEDFFAYYEDVDLSFRARLAGWQVSYVPDAVAKHQIGGTSNRMRGFTTYQALKNQPWVLIKNLPLSLWLIVWPRFILAYLYFILAAIAKGKGWYAIKGFLVSLLLSPKKFYQRFKIQRNRKLGTAELKALFYSGLPKDYSNLYKLVYFYKR